MLSSEERRKREVAEELKKVQKQRDREQAKKEKQVQDREQKERQDRQMKKMRKAPALPNKVVDESQMKSVTICRETVIRVQKDIPEADAIEKWYRVREERGYKWTAVKPKK